MNYMSLEMTKNNVMITDIGRVSAWVGGLFDEDAVVVDMIFFYWTLLL